MKKSFYKQMNSIDNNNEKNIQVENVGIHFEYIIHIIVSS